MLNSTTMKAKIKRSTGTETWLKTEYHCPKCGSERVWVNEEQSLGREDEQYICILCAFMFTMPVAGEITEGETELSNLVEALREASTSGNGPWAKSFPEF
jgi:predicted RNA-binding Zn-ribbon protein involved in translation (DUF1610 family)